VSKKLGAYQKSMSHSTTIDPQRRLLDSMAIGLWSWPGQEMAIPKMVNVCAVHVALPEHFRYAAFLANLKSNLSSAFVTHVRSSRREKERRREENKRERERGRRPKGLIAWIILSTYAYKFHQNSNEIYAGRLNTTIREFYSFFFKYFFQRTQKAH